MSRAGPRSGALPVGGATATDHKQGGWLCSIYESFRSGSRDATPCVYYCSRRIISGDSRMRQWLIALAALHM